MTSIAYAPVSIQTSSQAAPLPPPWFGEAVLIVAHLRKQGVLDALTQQVHFARRRFGRYEVIDLEDPGGNAGLIGGPEPADALDHLHKYVGGQVFRCGTIGYTGSDRAKDPGQESPIERAQRLGFASSRTIKLAVQRLHWLLTSVVREGLPYLVAIWLIVVTVTQKNTAHGPFVYSKRRSRNHCLPKGNYHHGTCFHGWY